MFNKTILNVAFSGLLIFTSSAQATLIDNVSSSIDTATGLEWLDVPLTQGQSFISILGGFGGFAAQGYVHATLSQLCSLFGSLGDAVPQCTSASDVAGDALPQSSADTLTSLLGLTLVNFGQISTGGIFDSGLLPGALGIGCVDAGTSPLCVGGLPLPGANRKLSFFNQNSVAVKGSLQSLDSLFGSVILKQVVSMVIVGSSAAFQVVSIVSIIL